MEQTVFEGAISAREEFFYPDTARGPLPAGLRLAMPLNGRPGVQLLLAAGKSAVKAALESDSFTPEFFAMKAVPVEYNTGDGTQQGGAMVLAERPGEKPAYATRLAPFWVYDCLKPAPTGEIEPENGLAALYVCLCPKPGLAAGEHTAVLRLGEYRCTLRVRVYGTAIPQDAFPVTNWFSQEAICRFHGVEKGTPAFYDMVRQYARAMRRMHQTMFYIELDDACVAAREPYQFDFEYLCPMIESFFAEGMQRMELGTLLSRGFLPGGAPDMYTDSFKCAMAPELPIDSPEGYAVTVRFVQALAEFLTRHGWQDKVLFHIHDEPDIHFKDQHTLNARKRQYYLAAGILRKYLPGVRVIEAVGSAEFRGGVDIWVPGTPGYEENQAAFDGLAELGEEVWGYVCCGPEGNWLNRFLDFALLKGRLLFWGCAANRLGGFLHWGFNQFAPGMDPFRGTSCPNPTGIGTNFPCGDAFVVYPGTDGPWPGMRMEAARRGAEDAALLALLRGRNPAAHDALAARVFVNNHQYNDDPAVFEQVYEELLRALEKQEAGA
ncbi:DUF4091 domain-containing protein [Allofournierella sp.]|uniref:DUF4091 domain-containing protein n=1 Tax=Allofournierella sp. TaxID=1940256 RepID=UPI003AEF6304